MGNNEHFDQLMLADNSGLTVEQQQFKDLPSVQGKIQKTGALTYGTYGRRNFKR